MKKTIKAPIISVFGSAGPLPGSADYENGRILGASLAESGFIVQTGGYCGIMEAVSRGANEAGGHVIGVTCQQIEKFRPLGANPWVIEEIKKVTLRARLLQLIDHCAAGVVMPGGIGTLSELSLMWNFVQVGEISPRPIVVVGGMWQRVLAAFADPDYVEISHRALLSSAKTVHDVNRILREKLTVAG
jgi:uncharacterized protein (TIGR00730 family)